MNQAQVSEIERLGGDPTDAVWHWFLRTGPHGASLTWGRSRGTPPGYMGIEHLERVIDEKAEVDPHFVGRARQVVEMAFSSTIVDFLRRAVQVAEPR